MAEQLQHPISASIAAAGHVLWYVHPIKMGHLCPFGQFSAAFQITHALSGPATVLHGRMEPGIETPVFHSKFAIPQETEKAKG